MSTLTIIQARMGSTRFPGKILAPLAGRPVISHVIARAIKADVGQVVVAVPGTDENAPVTAYLRGAVPVFLGPEDDVLGRFARAAALFAPDATTIVRITADCPLVDPATIADLVDRYESIGADYLGRTNAPDGNDVEVFSAALLRVADRLAASHEREHVTTWMRKRNEAVTLTGNEDMTGIKYSVDTVEDLRVCDRLLVECGPDAGWRDYVAALRRWSTG